MNSLEIHITINHEDEASLALTLRSLEPAKITVIVEKEVTTNKLLESRLRFIEQAQSPYVCLLSPGDVLPENMLDKLIILIEDSNPENYVGACVYSGSVNPYQLMADYNFPKPWVMQTKIAQLIVAFLRNQPKERTQFIYVDHTIAVIAGMLGEWAELHEPGCAPLPLSHEIVHDWYRSNTKSLLLDVYTHLKGIV